MGRRSVSEKIASQILDHGLAFSTFAENHPEAYNELLKYRKNIISDIELILLKEKKTQLSP